MRNRNLYAKLLLPVSLLIFAGLFTVGFMIKNESLRPLTVAAAIVLVASLVCGAVFMWLYTKPDGALLERWRGYSMLPSIKITDFKTELEQVRKNYEADTDPRKNTAYVKQFKTADGRTVQQTGKIYYAHIVEANQALFKRDFTTFAYPAVVVYSKDEYYEKHPYALMEISENLYADRHANILKNESKHFFNVKFSDKEGREIYISTIYIYRYHLPDGFLRGAMFPILADPENCKSVLVADSVYWTDGLVSNFMRHDENAMTYDVFDI